MKKQQIRAELKPERWQGANLKTSEPTIVDPTIVDPEMELQRRQPELIDKVLRTFENRLINDESLKPTLTEYLKLLQLEKELAQEQEGPREITVTWVEPEGNSSEE